MIPAWEGRQKTGETSELVCYLSLSHNIQPCPCLISPSLPVLTAKLVKEFTKTLFPLSVKITMGGKLGKAHNSYVVSGGEAGGSQSRGAMEEYLEDRRHSESDLNYSGGPINQ